MKYTRQDLLMIGAEFVSFLGYEITDADKPVRCLKVDTDEQLKQKLMDAMKKAEKDGWVGKDGADRDLSNAPDALLAFVYENDIVDLPVDSPIPEEEEELSVQDTEEETVSDEAEEQEAPVEAAEEISEDAELAAMQAEIDRELAAAETELDSEPAPEPPEKKPDPKKTVVPPVIPDESEEADEEIPPAILDEVDEKIETLAEIRGETDTESVFAKYAPVTVQNVEAAVIAITKLLADGKVVIISAHEIGGVPFAQHSAKAVTLPKTAAKLSVPDRETYIAETVASGVEKMVQRLNTALKDVQPRRDFCTQNKIKVKTGDIATAGRKALYFAIVEWERKRLTAAAEKMYDSEITG